MRASNLLQGLCGAALAVFAACSEAPDADATNTTLQKLGAIQLTVATTGVELDANGYTLYVDGASPRSLGANSSTLLSTTAGEHVLQLGGVASNCTVAGYNPLTVTVQRNRTIAARFDVACVATKGSIVVSTVIASPNADTDGYLVSIDGGPTSRIGASGSLTFGGIAPGDHTVQLAEIAANCAVTGPNPATVPVFAGATASVSFAVTCGPPVGIVHVRVMTTGSQLPDGYVVEVNGGGGGIMWKPISANGETVFEGVSTGNGWAALEYLAVNCSVASSVIGFTLGAGETADVTFEVACLPMGSVEVTAQTSGTELDPDGYVVRLNGSMTSATGSVAANGIATISGLPVGDYAVEVVGISPECSASWPRTVSVAASPASQLRIDAECSDAGRVAYVSAPWTADAEIHVARLDGTSTRITFDGYVDMDPTWSPDGSRIAYASQRDGNLDIYVMNADGSAPERLTTDDAADYMPAWSPDASRIAFTGDRGMDSYVFVMNADGTSVARLVVGSSPSWSPDGTQLVFFRGYSGLYVMNADGTDVHQITNAWDSDPVWSPDGSRIAFVRTFCDPIACDPSIVLVAPDGSAETMVVWPPEMRYYYWLSYSSPTWSPRGGWIMYASEYCVDFECQEFIREIWSIAIDGSANGYLAAGARDPAWGR